MPSIAVYNNSGYTVSLTAYSSSGSVVTSKTNFSSATSGQTGTYTFGTNTSYILISCSGSIKWRTSNTTEGVYYQLSSDNQIQPTGSTWPARVAFAANDSGGGGGGGEDDVTVYYYYAYGYNVTTGTYYSDYYSKSDSLSSYSMYRSTFQNNVSIPSDVTYKGYCRGASRSACLTYYNQYGVEGTGSSASLSSTKPYVVFFYEEPEPEPEPTVYTFYYTCYDTNGYTIKNRTSTTSTTTSKTITPPSIPGYTYKKCGRGTSSTNAYNNATSTNSSITATTTYQYVAFIYEENQTKPYWRNYNSTSSPLNASTTSLVTGMTETINPYEVIKMYFKSTVDGTITIDLTFTTDIFCSIGEQGKLVLSEASDCSGTDVVTGELASYNGGGDGKVLLNYDVTANTMYEIALHGYLMSYSGSGSVKINFTKANNYYCKVYAALVDSKGVTQNKTYAIISNLYTKPATSTPTLTTSMIAPISITGYHYDYMSSNSITSTSSSSPTIIYYYYRPDSYTVSYNANGGTFSGNSTSRYYNESYTLTPIEPTRSGYKFLGWSTNSTATTASYSSGATVPASTSTSNITYYAIWEQKFYLNIYRYYYDENEKTDIDFGSFSVLLPEGTYIIPSDYAEQALWNDIEKAQYEYVDTNEHSFYLNANTNLALYFKGKEYSINYYTNDDNNTILSQTYIHHPYEIYTNIIDTIPEKFGYNFSGWDTSDRAINAIYKPNQEFEKLVENINLYGVWSKKKKEPFYWTNNQDIKLGSDSKLINTHINSSRVNEFIDLIKFYIDKNAIINQVSKETKITKDFYNSLALLLGIATLSSNEKIKAQHWIDLQDAYNAFKAINESLLIDFDWEDNDTTYELTEWKGTLNGEPSTIIKIPEGGVII